MKRIVIVAPEDLPIPPKRGGSVQIYVSELQHAFAHQSESEVQLRIISPGPKVQHTSVFVRAHGVASAYRKQVEKRLAAMKPDLIQVENRPDFILRIKKKNPHARLILNLHSTTFLGPQHISPRFVTKSLLQADAIVVNSRYLKQAIVKLHPFATTNGRLHVIHPGVRLSDYNRIPLHHQRDAFTAQQPFQLLFVGRIIRQKGVHVIMAAMRILRQRKIPVSLTIVGRTPPWESGYGEEVRRKARGLHVNWVGFLPHNKLNKYYGKAHCLICPSQWSEAFGLVNVESLASGRPVIASSLGGIREIVNSSCGILVKDYHSARAFARAIESLVSDRSSYRTMSMNARKRAERFTWERTARKFRKLYEQL